MPSTTGSWSSGCTTTCTRSARTSPTSVCARALGLEAQLRNGAAVAPLHGPGDDSGRARVPAAEAPRRQGAPRRRRSARRSAASSSASAMPRRAVNSADVDVVVSGEQQEADGAFDSPDTCSTRPLGIPKGWIMLGHAVSEEPGMLEMAQWVNPSRPKCRCSSSRLASRSGPPNKAQLPRAGSPASANEPVHVISAKATLLVVRAAHARSW